MYERRPTALYRLEVEYGRVMFGVVVTRFWFAYVTVPPHSTVWYPLVHVIRGSGLAVSALPRNPHPCEWETPSCLSVLGTEYRGMMSANRGSPPHGMLVGGVYGRYAVGKEGQTVGCRTEPDH